MESNELLHENQDPPRLTGKARARQRAADWKDKLNARTMKEIDDTRKYRIFVGLSDEQIDEVQRLYAEIEERALQEREALRRSQEEVVEPVITNQDDYQQIDLPTITIPLDSSVEEVHSLIKSRVGPGIDDICPIESLYRFSSCQLLHYVAPDDYKSLSHIVHSFSNFSLILKSIHLNAPFISDEYSVFPSHDDFTLRSSTLKSIDFFRKYVGDHPDSYSAAVADDCRLLFSYTKPFGSFLPPDYTVESLAVDARRVNCLLRFVQPSDSELLQPHKLGNSLLPPAPYLAFINQLPVDYLNRKVVRMYSQFPNDPGKLVPASRVTCYYNGAEIDLLSLTEDQARRMSMKSWLWNSLPSLRYARRHSVYEDEVFERDWDRAHGEDIDW